MKTLLKALALSLLLFGLTGLSHAQFVQTVNYMNKDGTVSTVPMAIRPGGNEQTHLFRDPSVIKDLELVDEQIDSINRLMELHRKVLQAKYQEYHQVKDQEDPERVKEMRSALTLLQKSQQDELFDVLLPHQRDRLKQVSLQIQLKSLGPATALQHGIVGAELNITDAQKQKFAEIGKELQEQLVAKMAELKEEARKKVLAELTAEQRSKFESLTGESFKRDQNDWNEYAKKLQAESKKRQAESQKSKTTNR